MNITTLARPEIRALAPYAAAAQVDDTVRLNANEAPWSASGDDYRRPLNRYPEVRPAGLRVRLAEYYGCAAGNLLVTRGTSEAIDLLMRVFCRPGRDNVVTTRPTFSMYQHYAAIQGAELREVTADRDSDFALDAGDLLAACDDATRLVFLCSPNNPTGTPLPRGLLVDLIEKRRGRSVVVVDEAYVEFGAAPSVVDLLPRYENLVVLRTLSKALALAGARCGAVIGATGVVDMIDAVQAPYALATPVVECVENALRDGALAEAGERLAEVVQERERLIAAIRAFPCVRRVWPSAANFFLVAVDDAAALMRQSRRDNVLLRYFGGDLADCVRISVGTRGENDRLLATFAALGER